MKIAHVCSEYAPAVSGVGQVVEELAKRQAKDGHEVHIFAPDWDKYKRIKKKYEFLDGVHVHRCYHIARIANFATIFPGVFPKLLKGNFDIIHSHVFGHLHFVLAALAAKMSGAKHIHTTHCPWSDAPRSKLGNLGILVSYNIFSRIAMKMTDRIIAITPWEHGFIKNYGGSDEKIVTLPNGMDSIFFKKIGNNKFKAKNSISGNLVLFFGRVSFTKGADRFVKIAKQVLKDYSQVTFVIRGPDEGLLSHVKKEIKNEKKIIYIEPTRDRKEIAEMYQAADIFVMPSYREGLPLTLFEAMASGLPVVASPVNGIPYEMHDSKNGFLVDYGQDAEFAEKIIFLLKNKKERERISRNNILTAKKYGWASIYKKTQRLYSQVLKS